MARFSNIVKLNKLEREKLLIAFCQALVEVKKPEEAAAFITDLLSRQEALMLARRLEIAKLLIQGETYSDIQKALKVSHGTIARVNAWLMESGQGFRMILERMNRKGDSEIIAGALPWRVRRRRITLYNWPTELLEEIILSANKRQRQRIVTTLDKLHKKSSLYKELSLLMKGYNDRMKTN